MKLVIDIPDQKYKWIIENPQTYTDELHDAIRNGTPLPEHHGRLIDGDAITKDVETLQNSFVINMDNTTGKILGCECLAPTIIEADKEGKEE